MPGPSIPLDLNQGMTELLAQLSLECGTQLQVLLEKKHLYQKVSINIENLVQQLSDRVHPAQRRTFLERARSLTATTKLAPSTSEEPVLVYRANGLPERVPSLLLKNVKLLC